MNSLHPEPKHAIKTKLIHSKFQSQTAVCEHITPYQVKAQNFLPQLKAVLTLTSRHKQYLFNTPSKSPQIYSTKIHYEIHSTCMNQAKIKTTRFEVITAVLLNLQIFKYITIVVPTSSGSNSPSRWRWRHYKPSKRQEPFIQLYSITCQKASNFAMTIFTILQHLRYGTTAQLNV
jgi:hypothetical protein